MLTVKCIAPHDLRHTFASHAINSGFSLPIIAKMQGHADIKTTERYAHLHEDPINKAIDDVSLKLKKNDGVIRLFIKIIF